VQDCSEVDGVLLAFGNGAPQEAHRSLDFRWLEMLMKYERMMEKALVDVVHGVGAWEVTYRFFIEHAFKDEVTIDNLSKVANARFRIAFEAGEQPIDSRESAPWIPR
jgi:hypothetical protein